MDEKVIKEQKEFFNYFNNVVENKKLSHAYFMETNDYYDYKKVLVQMCKKILEESTSFNNINLIDQSFNYPEIKFLNSEGKMIKKEDIINLKNACMERPILGKYIIYIIDGAECLNASSANTLLKFLEEPADNIIGILVSNNRYQVINTIISRCQILPLVPIEDQHDENNLEHVKKFVKKIKDKELELFLENNNLYALTKEELLLFLDKVENYCLNKKDDIYNLTIIEIIEKYKQKLKFNVNMKLFIDTLVLELLEV